MLDTLDVLLHPPVVLAVALERAAATIPRQRAALTDWVLVRNEVRAGAGEALFDELVETISRRIASPPGFVVVRGLTFDRADHLLVAVTTSLGDLVGLDAMVPRKDYHGVVNDEGEMFLHTDGTRWRYPNRYTCQQFVSVELDGGGQSRVIGLPHLLSSLRRARRHGLLSFLTTEPLPWGLDAANGGGLWWSPIVQSDRIRWARFAIGSCDGTPIDLAKSVRSRIEEFQRFVQACPDVTNMSLLPNDLLIIDNHRCLHGRGPMRDRLASGRRLMRVRIAETSKIDSETRRAWDQQ